MAASEVHHGVLSQHWRPQRGREQVKYPNTRPSVDAMSTVAAGGVMCTATRRSTGALNGKAILTYEATGGTNFRSGSWLCKNASLRGLDRIDISPGRD